ncbi:MAG: ABC transporter ATP-binding protein [Marinirhabdus sp.]|nr:ABC transporter ATP-binding protein [Marinirhabdus sp.]
MSDSTLHPAISVDNVSIGYSHRKNVELVASQIHLKLNQGALIGLVGANGVGKSTLLRSLAGMQPIIEGTIAINGVSLRNSSAIELAQKLSIVLTEAPASMNLTVRELVTLGRQPYTNWMGALTMADQLQIEKALTNTETLKLANKKCFELSDGQLQRATIARALAQDTPIIILDEPTTHLDLYHRAYILKLLKSLADNFNKTILFATHEIDLAIQLSDQMIVMTPDNVYLDEPCNLIRDGKFDSLFPEDAIHFDKNTGRFSIKQ